ncbi:MAG: glycosyltransferase family 2 protein [Rhodobacteraceae bacterium]|nr:glycosyltransferase family 2 protein [Paracoccaceae bacterium]
MNAPRHDVAAVVIGRNEGARLERCLTSLKGQTDRLIYVDSGSIDGSIRFAASVGAEVVRLDQSSPFTAARARNAGFDALRAQGLPAYVQFVDGDCAVAAGWIAKGSAALDDDPNLGLVTGWRKEIYPTRNVYHAMAEVEWHRPAGDIRACGGDMMVRAADFDTVGGFDPTVIAAEDDEFCLRLGASGKALLRLPEPMTLHDLDTNSFGQWWKRSVRNGHGFAQLGAMHEGHFVAERRRVWLYGAALPLVFLAALVFGPRILALLPPLLLAASWAKTALGLRRAGQSPSSALQQALLLTASKIPNLQGMITFYLRRKRGAAMTLIEYK